MADVQKWSDRSTTLDGGNAPSSRPSLEQLARRLYAVLSDGHPSLRYNVRRGYWLLDRAAGGHDRATYTDEWRPARERQRDGTIVDRLANPFVLLRHLQGAYDVAIEAPSWSSLIVLDIDRPPVPRRQGEPIDLEAELRADARRDDILAAVWRAFEFDTERQPVVLRTPGGGYHLYLPLDRRWPAAWARERVEHSLDQHRLGLQPGVLELYPSGVPLRAPCGRGTALLVPREPGEPDDLQLEPRHLTYRNATDARLGEKIRRPVRDVPAYVADFLDRLESARRPIEDWLASDPSSPAWHETWGPWGERAAAEKAASAAPPGTAPSPHIGEVRKAAPAGGAPLPSGPGDGFILRGAAYLGKVSSLLSDGLLQEGERHDGVLKICHWYGKVQALPEEETLGKVEEWLQSRPHASATLEASGREVFLRQSLREARHYYRTRIAPVKQRRPGSPRFLEARQLTEADRQALAACTSPKARAAAAAILRHLAVHADETGRVPHPVNLSRRVAEELCGHARIVDEQGRRRRAAVVAREELEAAGVVQLHADYSVGRHGRRYTCWYRFGSGALPRPDPALGTVLGERRVEEAVLVVVAGAGKHEQPRVILRNADDLIPDGSSWWRRMYGRRAFTPAEFFEADRRHVLPGPFRHRRQEPADRTESPAEPPEGLCPCPPLPQTRPEPPGAAGGDPGAEAHASSSSSSAAAVALAQMAEACPAEANRVAAAPVSPALPAAACVAPTPARGASALARLIPLRPAGQPDVAEPPSPVPPSHATHDRELCSRVRVVSQSIRGALTAALTAWETANKSAPGNSGTGNSSTTPGGAAPPPPLLAGDARPPPEGDHPPDQTLSDRLAAMPASLRVIAARALAAWERKNSS